MIIYIHFLFLFYGPVLQKGAKFNRNIRVFVAEISSRFGPKSAPYFVL